MRPSQQTQMPIPACLDPGAVEQSSQQLRTLLPIDTFPVVLVHFRSLKLIILGEASLHLCSVVRDRSELASNVNRTR
jgi:hypothetical protein